jgi:hypothetical protein
MLLISCLLHKINTSCIYNKQQQFQIYVTGLLQYWSSSYKIQRFHSNKQNKFLKIASLFYFYFSNFTQFTVNIYCAIKLQKKNGYCIKYLNNCWLLQFAGILIAIKAYWVATVLREIWKIKVKKTCNFEKFILFIWMKALYFVRRKLFKYLMQYPFYFLQLYRTINIYSKISCKNILYAIVT